MSPDFGLTSRRTYGLVSAACSARAGKGMRASRRSPGPADCLFPKKRAPFPAFGGPLHDFTRRRNHGALLDTISRVIHRLRLLACAMVNALGFALRVDPSADLPLARAYRLRSRPSADPSLPPALARLLRHPVQPAPASLEIAATLAHRLVFATSVALVSPSRSRWFPEGTCTRSIRVSRWFRFGFPLPNRLSYKTDAVIDPESRKARNDAPCLWIT